MRLIQEHTGWNWHTDDPARLFIKNSGSNTEAPKMLECYVMHDSLNHGEFIEVEFEKLEFLASALFGAGRVSSLGSNTKWTGEAYTGEAYKDGIYRCLRPFSGHPAIVIIEVHGGGTQGYYWNTLPRMKRGPISPRSSRARRCGTFVTISPRCITTLGT
ncbi:MAG: hypothetical protein JWO91_3732 [Acidobacteriaceae bacterium]|nr:hypothetical protein [Acidobacteriaceae bacterium]